MIFKNFKKLTKYKQVVVYHHLGLGDIIVCNGLVNYISEKFDKVYLVVHDRYKDQADYLYSLNQRVEIYSLKEESLSTIKNYAAQRNLPILKIGFEFRKKGPFNIDFYKQLGLDYNISFSKFFVPKDNEKSLMLKKHLFEHYGVKKDFQLVHSQSDNVPYALNISKDLDAIYVEKESDIFNNIFLYIDMIKTAKEIHCVDSSFIHLVERIDTDATLYYHTNRNSITYLKKDWENIDYGH